MSVIYDIILAAIFVVLICRGWRQGVMSTLLRLLGWAAAAFIIVSFSESWAQSIYGSVVEPWAVSAVEKAIPAETVSAMNSGADAVESIQDVLDSLSGVLGGQVVDTGSASAIESALRQGSGSLAESITASVLQPILLSLIRGVLAMIILSVCLFVFRFLARASARRRRGRGILGKTNQLLGGALGIVESLAASYIYALALSILSTALTVSWLTPQILSGTSLVSKFL